MPCGYSKPVSQGALKDKKRLEINPIIPDTENAQKLLKIGQIQILPFLGRFLAFSHPRVIGFISSILHLFMHLDTQV